MLPSTFKQHQADSDPQNTEGPGRTAPGNRRGVPIWVHYMLTVLMIVAIMLFHLSLAPGFPLYRYPVLYILSVIASAYLFGFWPAMLSIILGFIAYAGTFITIGRPYGWEHLTSLGKAGIVSYILGTVVGAAGAITIRRSAERIRNLAAELAASNSRISRILESITDAFISLDMNDRFIYVNAEAGRILRRNPGYLIGKNIWEEFPEVRESLFGEQYRKVMTERKPIEFESLYPPPINAWYEVRAYPSPQGISIYFHNISRRKRAEEELARARDAAEESRATLQAIIDTVPVGLVVAAPDGRFLQANSAAKEIMGGPLIGAAGGPAPGSRYWFSTLSGNNLPAREAPLNVTLRLGTKISNIELTIKRKNKSNITALINSAPVKDSQGNIIAAVATINDITELSNLRKALERQVDTLQKALIPSRPSIGKSYRIADMYVPYTAGIEIGGDFYDVFKTENGKVGIMMGDVSGKGVEAATIAANTRGTAHAFAYDLLSAGAALTHTNSVLMAEQPEDFKFFITLFLGMLNLENGVMNYSNAGHPPPAVWHTDKTVEFLTLGHPPIGVVESEQYLEHTCRLCPGDKLILYTDGISEARHDSDLFELAGIEHVLKECGNLMPENLIKELLGAATAWANGRLMDDAAIIVLERVEPG